MRYANHVLVLVSLLGLVGAVQASVEKAEISDLAAAAEQIVVGDVVDIVSFWEDGLIRSKVTVLVDDYLLGSGRGIEKFVISGGTVGDLTLSVSVLPEFQIGDHVLLFLGHTEIRLVESFQGAFLTDGVDIVQMGPGCVRMIGETRQPLHEFLAAVDGALPVGEHLSAVSAYTGDFSLPMYVERYGLCGYDWTYKADPMDESYVMNGNCSDGSAGDASSQRTQIWNGATQWNNAGAEFEFTNGGASGGTAVTYNNSNLIYFDTTPPDGGSYVAANYHWYSGGNMLESDIVFNDRDYTWWNGSGACAGMDIFNIATHELGHTLCLADLYSGLDSNKTMYGYVSTCETKKRSLADDDIAGIIEIYGDGGGGGGDCDYIEFTQQPTPSQYVCDGNPVSLTVTVSGVPSPTYQWRRGTTNVTNNARISGAQTSQLIISEFEDTDAGNNYNCLVTNPADDCQLASDNAALVLDTVYPNITANPQSQSVDQGQPVLFSISVDVPSAYDYQWRKDGNDLSDDARIIGTASQSMIIISTLTSDAGGYDCVVTVKDRGQCSTPSSAATLTVNP